MARAHLCLGAPRGRRGGLLARTPAGSPLGIVRCAGAHRLDQSIIQPSTSKPYRRVARVMTAYSDFYYGCARTVRERTNWTDSAHCTHKEFHINSLSGGPSWPSFFDGRYPRYLA